MWSCTIIAKAKKKNKQNSKNITFRKQVIKPKHTVTFLAYSAVTAAVAAAANYP
ncbi:MAG: hypothetical protein WKF36_03545 [Candidatus Nitrosocosmicus sp.]